MLGQEPVVFSHDKRGHHMSLLKRFFIAEDPPEKGVQSSAVPILSDAELARELSKPAPKPAAPVAPKPVAPAPVTDAAADTPEEVYAAAGIPKAAMSAEQLLAFRENLKAMSLEQQRQAVAAWDVTDDRWDLERVLSEAELKATALEAACLDVDRRLSAKVAEIDEEEAKANALIAEATAEVEAQIKGLQEELASLLQTAADEKTARGLARVEAAGNAAALNTKFKAEAARLRTLNTLHSNNGNKKE